MTSELATQKGQQGSSVSMAAIENVLINGDLSTLKAEDRVMYYNRVCESLGLNPLTKPFAYLSMKDGKGGNKLVLYALKDCTEQLRHNHKVNLRITSRDLIGEIYVVTAQAKLGEREDESTGAVPVKGLTGDNLANAYMKAETKAKRRVTLSICGMGILDETEIDTIKDAAPFRESETAKMPQPSQMAQAPTWDQNAPKDPAAAVKREASQQKPAVSGSSKDYVDAAEIPFGEGETEEQRAARQKAPDPAPAIPSEDQLLDEMTKCLAMRNTEEDIKKTYDEVLAIHKKKYGVIEPLLVGKYWKAKRDAIKALKGAA